MARGHEGDSDRGKDQLMDNGTKSPIKKSIATKIILVVLGFYLLIGTVATLGQIWVEYRYQKRNIIQDLQDIENSFSNGLAVSLWGFDQEDLEASIDGMLSLPSLVGAVIKSDAGMTIAVGGIVTNNGKTGNVGFHVNLSGISDDEKKIHETEAYKFEIFAHQFPITYAPKNKIIQLGTATIYSNSSVIYRKMKLQVVMLVINIILIAGTFFIALLWTVNRYLRRPLTSLTSATGEVTLENLDSFEVKIGISDHNELRALEESFNLMINNLNHSMIEREKAREELARLNVDLKVKNEELEQVVYVASHDLRSPLVNIDGYSRELEYSIKDLRSTLSDKSLDNVLDELAPIIDEDIPEALRFIHTSTSKMETLLAGLLRLSRSGRAALKIESLDINQIIAKVITSTEFQIKKIGVKVIAEDLPPCQGDAIQMDQVFSNLIENALKCLDTNRPGVIRISGKIVDDQSVYCVEDNGIGIDVNHMDKIFEIFHQLDPAQNKGEGLGLTIVKRILTRLEGSIRVESTIGLGSRFYISMPKGNVLQEKGK